jgi:hypothetical protein
VRWLHNTHDDLSAPILRGVGWPLRLQANDDHADDGLKQVQEGGGEPTCETGTSPRSGKPLLGFGPDDEIGDAGYGEEKSGDQKEDA